MRRILILACVAAATPTIAQDAVPTPPVNALDLTCGDLMHALRVADPGTRPTVERQRSAQEAQDDIAQGLTWMHGYKAGKYGPENVPPLTPDWLQKQLKSVITSCNARSPDGMLSLLKIVEP